MDSAELSLWRERVRRSLRRHVLGHRRLLAGLCAALAELTALDALRPSSPAVVAAPPRPVTPASLAASHPALSVVPVRLPDAAMASLLRVGDRIDLLATDPDGGETTVVGDHALVLALPPAGGSDENGGESAVTSGLTGRLVVVGVPPGTVESVTSASVRDFLSYAYAH